MLVVIMIILIDDYSDMFDLAPVPPIILYIWLVMFLKWSFLATIPPTYADSLLFILFHDLFFYTIKFQALVSFIMYSLSSLEIYSQLLLHLSIIALELSRTIINQWKQLFWLAGYELSLAILRLLLLPEICTQQDFCKTP